MPTQLAREYQKGQEALRALLRELARDDLWLFLNEVLFHPEIECDGGRCCEGKKAFYEPLHKPWCDWAANDSLERKLLLAPRGHFKSTVVSYGKVCHAIIQRPDIRILLVSALDRNAINFNRQIKSAFQYNKRMAWLFPEFCVEAGKQFGPEDSFITPARTNYSLAAPTLTSTYIDAALASQHYDLIVMDDPIEAKHVATEEQAAKARSSYNKIIPLLDPPTDMNPTGITVVGTRWAYFDLYSTLVPTDQGGLNDATSYSCIVRSCLESNGQPDFEGGDPIFPTRFPRSRLMQLLEEARGDDRLGEQFWWNQYMNLCRPPERQPFMENWFIEVDSQSLPPLFAKMIVVDTALKDDTINKKGARGDYTVLLVVGWDREGRLYVIDGLRSNSMTSKLFCDALVTFAQKYSIPTVVKQRVSEDTLGTQIRDAFYSVKLPIDYRPLTIQHLGRKVQRIKDALQAPMQRGEIMWVKRLLGNGDWEHHRLLDQCRKELVNLGQYPVDDVADALANCYHPDVKFMKTNLVGPMQQWTIPIAPTAQLSDPSRYRQWRHLGGQRRGAGYSYTEDSDVN